MNEDDIREALGKLDPGTDAHWTKGGLPDLNAMRELVGEYVSREACTNARPGFTRETAQQGGGADDQTNAQGTEQASEPGAATTEDAGAPDEPKAEAPTDPAPEPAAAAPEPVEPGTAGDLKATEAGRKAKRPGCRFNWN